MMWGWSCFLARTRSPQVPFILKDRIMEGDGVKMLILTPERLLCFLRDAGRGQDTFYVGRLKEIGRIDHQVAGDCFSSVGAANVYDNKTTKVSPDVGENHLAKKVAPVKIESPYRLWNRVSHLA
jgi:hypothetical protein